MKKRKPRRGNPGNPRRRNLGRNPSSQHKDTSGGNQKHRGLSSLIKSFLVKVGVVLVFLVIGVISFGPLLNKYVPRTTHKVCHITQIDNKHYKGKGYGHGFMIYTAKTKQCGNLYANVDEIAQVREGWTYDIELRGFDFMSLRPEIISAMPIG